MGELVRSFRHDVLRHDLVRVPFHVEVACQSQRPCQMERVSHFWAAVEAMMRKLAPVPRRLLADFSLEDYACGLSVNVLQPVARVRGFRFIRCKIAIGVSEGVIIYGPGVEVQQ